MEEKVFAMSMFGSEKDLWKAKAEYYEDLYKKTLIAQTDGGAEVTLDCGVMADAIAIYKPPFSFKGGYIWDEGNIVADQGDGDDRAASLARIRGWGRISYMENPESLQDAIGKHMAIALTEYWQKKRP